MGKRFIENLLFSNLCMHEHIRSEFGKSRIYQGSIPNTYTHAMQWYHVLCYKMTSETIACASKIHGTSCQHDTSTYSFNSNIDFIDIQVSERYCICRWNITLMKQLFNLFVSNILMIIYSSLYCPRCMSASVLEHKATDNCMGTPVCTPSGAELW